MTSRTAPLFPLRPGRHPDPGSGMCAMEMVAWLAGEAHSDEPTCACPVIGAVVRCLNDALPDDRARERLLRPLVPMLVHTRADAGTEQVRAFAAVDVVVREIAPAVLRRLCCPTDAEALASMPPLRSRAQVACGLPHLQHAGVRAARWVVQRVADGALEPRLWIAGVVWAARELPGSAAWHAAERVVRAMVAVRAEAIAAAALRLRPLASGSEVERAGAAHLAWQ